MNWNRFAKPRNVGKQIPAFRMGVPLAFGLLSAASIDLVTQAATASAYSFRRDEIPQRASMARQGATLPVTSCADDGGASTLRAVFSSAQPGDTVDLTQLTCGLISLETGAIASDAFNITVLGPGADRLVIDGGGVDRVFDVTSATFSNLSITRGYASGDFASGGCIISAFDVTLISSRITDCKVVGAAYARGGAVFAGYSAHLISSTVSGNQAIASSGEARGGGVDGHYGGVSAVYSTIVSNTASGAAGSYGGGLFGGGMTFLDRSTISGNVADVGGGVFSRTAYLASGFLRLSNSTVSGNTARVRGGGVATRDSVSMQIRNSTIAFNQAGSGSGGGGFFSVDHQVELFLESSIVAMNGTSGSIGSADIGTDSFPLITVSGTNNLVGRSGLQVPSGTISLDPKLAPLADNGGPTMTHALMAGSPALDAGIDTAGLGFDQRGNGFPRTSGAGTDIGAYEERLDLIFYDGFDG